MAEWVNRWVDTKTGEPCKWMTPELDAKVNAAYDKWEAGDVETITVDEFIRQYRHGDA